MKFEIFSELKLSESILTSYGSRITIVEFYLNKKILMKFRKKINPKIQSSF